MYLLNDYNMVSICIHFYPTSQAPTHYSWILPTDLVVNKNDEDGNHNIYNTPENFLPSTGGRGFAIFSLVAVAGLGGAGVLYALKCKNAQDAA